MASNYWHNGFMYTSWELEKELKKLDVKINDFTESEALISFLYNLMLDHSNKGQLDDVGLDIQNCIEEIRRIN